MVGSQRGVNFSISTLGPGTLFERPRGISEVTITQGVASVTISGLEAPEAAARVRLLGLVADRGVNIDFCKLIPGGLAFVVDEAAVETVEQALAGTEVTLRRGRAVVMVHAANIREEEGLLASALERASRSGVELEHAGDMHDRLLLVCAAEEAERLREVFS